MSSNITYEQLKVAMRERAGVDGFPGQASIPNTLSALNGFLRVLGLTEKALVGDTLGSGFNASVELMVGCMENEQANTEHIKNRRSAMQHWHCLVNLLDHEYAVTSGSVTPFQRRLRELHESIPARSRSSFYRRCGVDPNIIYSWMRGTAPRHDSFQIILRIEREGELAQRTLLDLLPYNRLWERQNRPECDTGPVIEYREKMARIRRDRIDNPDRVPVLLAPTEWTSELREEWMGLVVYKTGIELTTTDMPMNTALGALRSAMAAEPKTVRKQWRLRPKSDYPPMYEAWATEVGAFRVPTAAVTFGNVSGFLGWARLPGKSGGKGMEVSQLTLGLVTREDLLREYIEWRTVRAGATNQGIATFLNQMGMLVHEKTGYLPRHPEIGRRVGISDPLMWEKTCSAAKAWIATTNGNIAHLIRPTREPSEPIRFALDGREPLEPFIQGIRRYARHVPAKEVERSTQARDLLLIALTMTNPLRAANLRLLTYRSDNTGSFRKKRDGGWELFVPSEQFKNFRGAANEDYHQNIDPSVWPFLENYLDHHRKILAPMARGLVFVANTLGRGSRGSGEEELWDAIADRFRWITHSYVPGCPGVGPHAMRYIVGTSIIVRTKGDYVLAAKVLHDLPETVRRHYAKLLEEFANRGRDEVLGPVLASIHAKRLTLLQ